MAPCGKSKCNCCPKKKKTTKAKPRAKPRAKTFIPYSSPIPNQAMTVPSVVSQVSMPVKKTAEISTQTVAKRGIEIQTQTPVKRGIEIQTQTPVKRGIEIQTQTPVKNTAEIAIQISAIKRGRPAKVPVKNTAEVAIQTKTVKVPIKKKVGIEIQTQTEPIQPSEIKRGRPRIIPIKKKVELAIQTESPLKNTSEFSMQTEPNILNTPDVKKEEIRPLIKSSRYNRSSMIELGKEKPDKLNNLLTELYLDNVDRRALNTPTMPTSNVPYSSVLGVNIPIKTGKGEYIKKETGLKTKDIRGAPKAQEFNPLLNL